MERASPLLGFPRRLAYLCMLGAIAGAGSLPAGSAVGAQAPTRTSYHASLPPAPSLVAQTDASARLHLYGDASLPGYRDVEPADGIDDIRADRLRAIAERFSPILRRNNFLVPRDVWWVLGDSAILHVDTWRDGVLTRSERIDLGAARRFAAAGNGAELELRDDARLRELLDVFDPERPRPAARRPGTVEETILYFDTPGHDAASWRRAYERRGHRESRIYAHFALTEEDAVLDPAPRYRLVVQYWFFYPFNDAGNNHEGDWEHINVVIVPVSHLGSALAGAEHPELMTADEVSEILDGDRTAIDSLTIAFVDYFFHHNVMTVDYLAVRAPERRRPSAPGDVTWVWEDPTYVPQAVMERLAAFDGRIATHPVGYIGGNSKGPDELLVINPRFAGSYNRNSGATYPFPATWQTVGPLGATEKVVGSVVPPVRREYGDSVPDGTAWYDVIDADRYLVYLGDDIILMPDWERLARVVRSNAQARREWSWLILPVRWGFPAIASPGAGMVKHSNLGNLAPFSPTYSPGWNHIGPTIEHGAYRPRVLRTPLSPTTPWAIVQSGWGVLNVPLAAFGLMPGGNVAVTQLLPWVSGAMHAVGASGTRTFTPVLPTRFTSASPGAFLHLGGEEFAFLLPQGDDEAITRRNGTSVDRQSLTRETSVGGRLWFDLHFGRKLAIENAFSWDASTVQHRLLDAEGAPAGIVRGSLTTRELTGGFRLAPISLSDDAVQIFTRFGYGWTRYTLSDVAVADSLLERPVKRGGYLPSILPSKKWWPNTAYFGAGVELFAPKDRWILGRLGYGLRLEATGLLHRMDGELGGRQRDLWVERMELASGLVLGW